jgi:transposase
MELGVRSELVSRWKREYKANREGSFSGHRNSVRTDAEKEIARLKKELKETLIERDILKNAASILSRSDSKNTSL